jgi:hypothetical protein
MLAQEKFLLREMAALEADLHRFQRMLDGLRLLTMKQHACSDIDAELHLQADRTWKQLRRQQAAARRAWLAFQRALDKHRKAHPAPEANESEPAPTGPPHAPAPPDLAHAQPASQPAPAPLL